MSVELPPLTPKAAAREAARRRLRKEVDEQKHRHLYAAMNIYHQTLGRRWVPCVVLGENHRRRLTTLEWFAVWVLWGRRKPAKKLAAVPAAAE